MRLMDCAIQIIGQALRRVDRLDPALGNFDYGYVCNRVNVAYRAIPAQKLDLCGSAEMVHQLFNENAYRDFIRLSLKDPVIRSIVGEDMRCLRGGDS